MSNVCVFLPSLRGIIPTMSEAFPPETKVPHHLAIIPDGDRRWAKLHNLPSIKGHQKGFDVLLKMAKQARKWGIHTVTIWVFSTENWKRKSEEVKYLMKIEEEMLKKYLPEAQKDNVRIIHLGRKDRIPKSFAKAIQKAEEETKKNTRHILNIAIDYGGRDEILRAIEKLNKFRAQSSKMTEGKFSEFLDTAGQPHPDPDLLIRTSGEMRTSGLLPWQMTYTEFYFIKKHLPDCTVDDLKDAIVEYSHRQRRFGGN